MKLKRTVYLFLVIIISLQLYSMENASNPLESFRWRYRVLIVDSSETLSDSIISSFKASQSAIQERHLIWFVLSDSDCMTNLPRELPPHFNEVLREKYFADDTGSNIVILIGKDGGIKAAQETLDLEAIFGRIDSMPMRRAEIRTQISTEF